MKQLVVHIVTLMSLCCLAAYGLNNNSPIGNCPRCKKFDVSTFEPLKRVAMIKAEIMRRLGISEQPTERNTESKTKHAPALEHRQRKASIEEFDTSIQTDDTRELSELLSYSELSGKLAHICPGDFSILFNWTSPFPNLGVSGVLFSFYIIFDRNSCKQTMKNLTAERGV